MLRIFKSPLTLLGVIHSYMEWAYGHTLLANLLLFVYLGRLFFIPLLERYLWKESKPWSPSCTNFIMFWLRGKCLTYNSTKKFKFLTSFFSFFHNILNMIWTAPTFNCKYSLMRMHTSHRPYGYPPFTLCSWQQAHRNPWCNSWHLVAIVHDVDFHVGWKQLHALFFKHVQLLLSTS